jgi:iron complex transport system substrate-binding protein
MTFRTPTFTCRQGIGLVLAVLVLLWFFLARAQPAGAAEPPRILSLSPAITELVYALGLEGRLVGVTTYCNYPPAALKKPRVGSARDLNVELIVTLKPQVILATEGDPTRLARLERLTHAKAYVLPTRHVADIWANMRTIARLESVVERGERAIAERRKALDAVAARAKKRATHPTAFYMVWDKPLMTAGAGSYLNDLITLAGGRNVAASATGGSYPTSSWEALLAQNPDVILGPTNMAPALQALKTQYPSLKAVRANRLRTLSDDLISRPGPRVAQALEAVEAALR